jgi:hypothetical protein
MEGAEEDFRFIFINKTPFRGKGAKKALMRVWLFT